jgi:hypothetical protein
VLPGGQGGVSPILTALRTTLLGIGSDKLKGISEPSISLVFSILHPASYIEASSSL